MLRTRSCLVFPLLKAVRFHFLLGALAGFERELGFGLNFATRTSEVSDTIVAPPRPRLGQQPAGFGPEAHARSFRHRQQHSVRSRSPARPEQSCCSLAAMSAIVKPAIQPSFFDPRRPDHTLGSQDRLRPACFCNSAKQQKTTNDQHETGSGTVDANGGGF
jgi:hypothetical protein